MQDISLFRIKRYWYKSHLDFYIVTSLNEDQITDVLEVVLMKDLDDDCISNDEHYVSVLKEEYPDHLIFFVKDFLHIDKTIDIWENIKPK